MYGIRTWYLEVCGDRGDLAILFPQVYSSNDEHDEERHGREDDEGGG